LPGLIFLYQLFNFVYKVAGFVSAIQLMGNDTFPRRSARPSGTWNTENNCQVTQACKGSGLNG
jgi:hypothetical protein